MKKVKMAIEIRKSYMLRIMISIYQGIEKNINWHDGITVFETRSTRYDRKICQCNIVTLRKPVQSSETFIPTLVKFEETRYRPAGSLGLHRKAFRGSKRKLNFPYIEGKC